MDVKVFCDKCKKNEVQIYNDSGNCCILCWYDMTDPIASSELKFFSGSNDSKHVISCRYCNQRLEPIDYSFFELGFDFDGKKYYGCRNCSFKYVGLTSEDRVTTN